jgi:restriction endonuclease S subunit
MELEKLSEKYSLKYILAVLNSSYAMAFLNNYRRHRLENYFYPDDFRKFPIPQISLERQQSIAAIADTILAAKAAASKADTTALERQIDNLVYHLYNLTYDEVKVIEPEFPLGKAEYEGITIEERK